MNKKQIKFVLSLASIILVLGVSIHPGFVSKSIFAENSSQSAVEKTEAVETPEPTDAPEQKNEIEDEQEVEQTHQEVENELEQGDIEKIEIQSSLEKPGKGTLKIEKTDGTTTEKTVSASQSASIVEAEIHSGKVAIHIEKDGTLTLVDEELNIHTEFPVVIDPKLKTIAIRTSSGVTTVNTLPSQDLNNIENKDKPTTVQSAILGEQNGEAYYNISGLQQGRLFGFIPVTAKIETKIKAQDGTKISVSKPWYLNIFGFAYSI